MSIFEELKRRNVFRVGIAYLVAAWLLLQVTDVVAPILELPGIVSKGVLLVLAIGFPICIILAWAYELTPDGVALEIDVDRSKSITANTGRKLDFVIIGVLTVAVVIFAMEKFVWSGGARSIPSASTEQQSIAVLPFVNMSSDEQQEFFSDGLTEELLNLLARMPELRVTSRSSSFYYKDKDFRIAEVGEQLGVSHILEGSVRRSEETIRITAQLVNVADDDPMWSETWDRTFDDIFLIQDEIAQSVVDQLRIRLLGETPRTDPIDPDVFTAYLRAKHLRKNRSVENVKLAEKMLREVVEQEPQFVAAWLELASAYWDGAGIAVWQSEEAALLAREAANVVLRLEPNNGLARATLATIAQQLELDMATASREIQIALLHSPNEISVVSGAAVLAARTGNADRALELLEKMVLLDPLGIDSANQVALVHMVARRYADAEAAFRKLIEVSPDRIGNHQRLAATLLLQGKYESALEEAEKVSVEGRRRSVSALIYQTMGNTQQAELEHERLIELGERWTYEIAQIFASRGMADEAIDWLNRAIARNDTGMWWLVGDPFMDPIRGDPRFADIEERLGIDREKE